MKIKQKAGNLIVYSILILLLIYWLFPLFIAILNSFKTNGELLTNVLSLPKELQFENYFRTFEKMSYARSLMNTVIVASIGVSLMILFSAMAGWRLARTKTKLSTFIFGLFVFSMLVPFSSIMIPLYKTMLMFNINNSLIGLGFVYVGLGVSMAIFLYHGFVKSIPKEIEESALMDGCRPFQIFIYIIFPLLKPVTVTVCITNVLWIWNDFLLPLIALSNNEKYTLLLSTNTLFGQYSSDWSAILSALILAAIPVIVFYVIFQKSILKGIAEGATKG
ncbi:carbohydrate ABC transporter permease [Neobacillus sp. 3P2-tot-E-2]|uniref:carbohydrate ABC transporter permease n=1 Tax=Neobacillus sp. 3P2-tot-E-2 TaxID=3132212 RepID=UPI0039A1A749